MQKLTFRSIGKMLEKQIRRKLLILAVARIAANLLDLLGLAGIAALASVFSALASGNGASSVSIPGFEDLKITEVQAVFVALGVATVFLLKSGFSIWLNLRAAILIADIESKNSLKLAIRFFQPAIDQKSVGRESVSEFQNKVVLSNEAVSIFINARMTFFAELALVIAMIAVFLLVNPLASVATLIFLGSILFFLNRLISSKIQLQSERQMEGYKGSLQVTRDLFGIRKEATIGGAVHYWLESFRATRELSARARGVSYTLNSLPRYVIETSLIFGLFAFVGGVVIFSDLQSQAVTIGVFLAGGLRLVASVLPLQSAYIQMQDGATRGRLAIEGLLSSYESPEVPQKDPKQTSDEDSSNPVMEFKSVSFSYSSSEALTIEDISFRVDKNTKVALVGPSGAGKSTVFELATGFLSPSDGEVRLLGHDPRWLKVRGHAGFAIVPQRPHLVTGPLATNVSLKSIDDSDLSRVASCLRQSGLASLLGEENWFLKMVNPDSGQLSGGEIQRLGLARALYQEPKVLFLDEATSALDAETEAGISEFLDSLKTQMTVVLIAHRLSTVIDADKIIYLDAGRIVGEGTFQELKNRIPDFAKAVELMDLSKEKE